ncbi:response regulator transcription factor [Ralstonia solanacearum]|uniref:response regulator transcription factor n=1 Tax=Ralstonia solanacearum TaxID=305 RepID=UPI00078C27EE|nr:response regulator transcription factor [Ralstonia solanacearum]AMP36340.1 DNA-binding response regulator [Ralstonia solanacearum]AXV85134.1 DNA-binding response regulator [Ralstonia solanacearum]AXW04624.1 DNA-binding response regulator [Ralstonia solanacearum]AXW22377.1 DNA-binding response regulator [Ralstonia solanacearum]AXW79335.1 DNA-binding response regulator [Ralstonia solanacearum]
MQAPVRFAIADDHPGVVAAVRHLVCRVEGFEVVGEATSADALLALLGHVRCDVVITDYAMPASRYGDGIVLLEFLLRRHPGLRIVVLTMLETRAVVDRMQRAGIRVIANKADGPHHILEGVRAALAGRPYLSPRFETRLGSDGPGHASADHGALDRLGKRELEVLRMYVGGETVSEIARRLNRSVKTVSAQKQKSMRKLRLATEAALFDFAARHGLLGTTER